MNFNSSSLYNYYVSPLIPDYPQTSPENSRYLPMSGIRDYTSMVDKITDEHETFFTKTIALYKGEDVFDKLTAVGVLNSLKEGISDFFGEYSREWCDSALRSYTDLTNPIIEEIEGVVSTKKFYKSLSKITYAWNRQTTRDVCKGIEKGFFEIKLDDYLSAGTKEEEIPPARILTCQHFAFYKLNELWAKDYLFTDKYREWPQLLRSEPERFFQQYGYRMTTIPVPGDLVVYCSSLKGFLESKHYGIWTANEKVLGKVGRVSVFEHAVDNVIIGYGDFVYFFHKEVTTALQTDFLGVLRTCDEEMSYSPLTISAFSYKLVDLFQDIPISCVYPRSIYNQEYNLELRDQITDQLLSYAATGNTKSRTDVCKAFKEITMSASSTVKSRI